MIKNHNLEIDYDLSYAYSDSLHDIPMLKMVKNRIKIDTKDGHMSTFEIEQLSYSFIFKSVKKSIILMSPAIPTTI